MDTGRMNNYTKDIKAILDLSLRFLTLVSLTYRLDDQPTFLFFFCRFFVLNLLKLTNLIDILAENWFKISIMAKILTRILLISKMNRNQLKENLTKADHPNFMSV